MRVAHAAGVTRVLLADDDPRIRRLLANGLARIGFDVVTADDAGAAIELALASTPDLVLVDLNMPTRGTEVVRVLKQRCGTSIWIAVLSGSEDHETRLECFDAGADDVIPKPVQLPDLRRRMSAAAASLRSASPGEPARSAKS